MEHTHWRSINVFRCKRGFADLFREQMIDVKHFLQLCEGNSVYPRITRLLCIDKPHRQTSKERKKPMA